MNKTVFRPYEFTSVNDKVLLKLSHFVPEEEPEEVIAPEPVYEGPTVDDLRRDADAFKKDWEIEKQHLLEEAKAQAEHIVKEAEATALYEVKSQTEQIQALKADSEAEMKSLLENAKSEAEKIVFEAQSSKDILLENSQKEGLEAGNKAGYETGYLEASRLIERLHAMIEKIMAKRQEILAETEQQVVDLVLLMTRKVVKVISENHKEVITANIKEALRKVKTRGDVIIHVNLADFDFATEHKKDFISTVETIKNITIAEDTTVDQGGCVVETDFGSVDARIASQLGELEQKILEISPVRTNSKKSLKDD